MTIALLTSPWFKCNDMSLFKMCVIVCTQTYNLKIFDPKDQVPLVCIDVSCVGRYNNNNNNNNKFHRSF